MNTPYPLHAVQLTDKDELIIIDQTLLPGELRFCAVTTLAEMIDAIKKLKVRGAPAIGIFAAYSVYLLAKRYSGMARTDMLTALIADIDKLRASRPTAVNLAWALTRMEETLRLSAAKTPAEMLPALRREAVAIDMEDAAISAAIADIGSELIRDGMGLLTHCNAGWLATSRLGTALAPMYRAHQQGKSFRVYCDETRPLLQGARLTSYELSAGGIDTTLICDNMAASLMAAGKIDMVFVGTDRVAANGDIANKIGTLSVAVNAAHFGIPFYVCAPSSTIDLGTAEGKDIIIEQRDMSEITEMWYNKPMVPKGIKVYNPAFDVTPYELITGIITEKGFWYPVR